MPIKISIILTVLINFGIHSSQGEVIRGVKIKRINITPIVGNWYLLASSKLSDLNLCVACTVEQQSENNFLIAVTLAPKIDPTFVNTFILSAAMKNDSNIIYTIRGDTKPGPLIVMFNIGYDSHVGLYVADSLSAITIGRHGSIYVIGRDRTLPDEILDDVKDSNFYQEGINPFDGLFAINSHSCEI